MVLIFIIYNMSFLSAASAIKIKDIYMNGFLDCSGNVLFRGGNVIIGNTSYPGYNINQRSLTINGSTEMNGNLIVNGNISNIVTQPPDNDSSTKIPTTAWVQSAITNT